MPKSYILSPLADTDREEIWLYIARDNPKAADKIDEKLEAAFSKLTERPHMGHLRDDLTDKPVRFWPIHSYLIVYDPDTDPLRIIRILSGYRDIGEIL